jgi:hypothetical protein
MTDKELAIIISEWIRTHDDTRTSNNPVWITLKLESKIQEICPFGAVKELSALDRWKNKTLAPEKARHGYDAMIKKMGYRNNYK